MIRSCKITYRNEDRLNTVQGRPVLLVVVFICTFPSLIEGIDHGGFHGDSEHLLIINVVTSDFFCALLRTNYGILGDFIGNT